MTKFKELFEKSDYAVYHNSYTQAIQAMELYVKKQGYTLDKEEMADVIGLGPKKPSKGKTNKLSLAVFKNGKEQKQRVHFQIYNRGTSSNEFELNTYIA